MVGLFTGLGVAGYVWGKKVGLVDQGLESGPVLGLFSHFFFPRELLSVYYRLELR